MDYQQRTDEPRGFGLCPGAKLSRFAALADSSGELPYCTGYSAGRAGRRASAVPASVAGPPFQSKPKAGPASVVTHRAFAARAAAAGRGVSRTAPKGVGRNTIHPPCGGLGSAPTGCRCIARYKAKCLLCLSFSAAVSKCIARPIQKGRLAKGYNRLQGGCIAEQYIIARRGLAPRKWWKIGGRWPSAVNIYYLDEAA